MINCSDEQLLPAGTDNVTMKALARVAVDDHRQWLHNGSKREPMPTLTLKNIPAALHRRLKVRADLHSRSLNSEVIACLQAAVEPERIDAAQIGARARLLRSRISGKLTDVTLGQLKRRGRP